MERINRIKVVLAEKQRTNKWLAEKLGKDTSTVSKWCTNSSQLHISVIPTQAFRSYPPSLFPIKWHWVANL